MRLLLIFAAVLLTLSPAARAQAGTSQAGGNGRTATATPSAAEVQSFAGCYELHVGRSWPWGPSRDGWLPRRIELLGQRGTAGFEKDNPLMYAIPPKNVDSQWRESPFWAVQSAKEVRIVDVGHFGGDILNLHKTRSGFSGWDHSHSDVAFSGQITHVTARRIPCVSSQLKE